MYSDPTGHSLLAILGLAALLVGALVGITASSPVNDSTNSNVEYYDNRKDEIDTKTPPNPESGYLPPKKNPNPQKVKNPNGTGKGWPSSDGGVWVPDNNQHGGAGWTVQYPDGTHEHRYPNGHVRSHNFSSNINIPNIILGGSIILGAGIGIIIVALDDATLVGMLDDASMPILIGAFSKGVEMVVG